MDQVMPMPLLHAGDVGEIVDIVGEPKLVAQLAEKGVRLGGHMEAIQVGDPFIVVVEGTRLTIRLDGRVEILVRLVSPQT